MRFSLCGSLSVSSLSLPLTSRVGHPCPFPRVSFFPGSYCVAGCPKAVRAFEAAQVGSDSREKRENRQGAGGAKSFWALTEAKGEEGRPAPGKFGDN